MNDSQSAKPNQETNAGAAPKKPPSAPRRHLLNLTLAGLPELEMFPTDQERQVALQEIGEEAGSPASGGFWFAIAVIVGTVLTTGYLSRWLLSVIDLPRFVKEMLQIIICGAAFFMVLRWLHRSGTAKTLREKLLARGVPVCIKCGYLLHGLSPATARCPECGTPFSERVRSILVPPGSG